MKKQVTIAGLILVLCASFAMAQASYTTTEFRALLINIVNNHLYSNQPKLDRAEVKDLITTYVLSQNGRAETTGTGIFSGEKISDIIDKYNGNNPPPIANPQITTPPIVTPPVVNPPIGNIPPGIQVKTLTPSAIKVRYSCMCGMATESISPGETKYYMINMTDWPAWQDAYLSCKRTTIGYGGKTYPDEDREQYMQTYRASNQKDKYVTKLGSYSTNSYDLGCNVYSGNFGCETNPGDVGIRIDMLTAMGYDRVPVLENINKFYRVGTGWNYWVKVAKGPTSISSSNPIAAANSSITLAGGGPSGVSNGQGNGEYPIIGVPVSAAGAKSIYIMVHNEHSYNWDKPRNFLILMECPIGSPP